MYDEKIVDRIVMMVGDLLFWKRKLKGFEWIKKVIMK